MTADEIWASPTTLTGSIGIGATLPTFPRALDWLGVHMDGTGTTELSGQFDLRRGLGPDAEDLIAQMIDFGYEDFIAKVAEHRERDIAEIDAAARGRVWISSAAMSRDLIDEIGDIDEAIVSAAELAGLEEGDYAVEYVERDLGFSDRLALGLVSLVGPLIDSTQIGPRLSPAFERLLDAAQEPFRWFDSLNDPRNLYAYCFCDTR